jgi:hypothetical protein
MIESYIAFISIKNGMKSFRKISLRLGEMLYILRNNLGLTNLHMAVYNDTHYLFVLHRISNKLRTSVYCLVAFSVC